MYAGVLLICFQRKGDWLSQVGKTIRKKTFLLDGQTSRENLSSRALNLLSAEHLRNESPGMWFMVLQTVIIKGDLST